MEFDRVNVTGDIHGDVEDLIFRTQCVWQNDDDLIFILGDNGFEFNTFYSLDGKLSQKDKLRQIIARKNIKGTIVCIQGNHEVPFKEMHGEITEFCGAKCKKSNGIYFIYNGEVMNINGKKVLALGGAYSIDKDQRLANNYPYWENEEMNQKEMQEIYNKVKGQHFDIILSHTCPLTEMPKEMFIQGCNSEQLENRTERFLEAVKRSCTYDKWFCGHFHTNKEVGKTTFLYKDIEKIDELSNGKIKLANDEELDNKTL